MPNYIDDKELASMLLELREKKQKGEKNSTHVAILDVRDDDFNSDGCIPTAIHVPSINFEANLSYLSDQLTSWLEIYDKLIVVLYCSYSQVRGPTCARMLLEYYKRVNPHPCLIPDIRILKGGFSHWVSQYRQNPCLVTRYVYRNTPSRSPS